MEYLINNDLTLIACIAWTQQQCSASKKGRILCREFYQRFHTTETSTYLCKCKNPLIIYFLPVVTPSPQSIHHSGLERQEKRISHYDRPCPRRTRINFAFLNNKLKPHNVAWLLAYSVDRRDNDAVDELFTFSDLNQKPVSVQCFANLSI